MSRLSEIAKVRLHLNKYRYGRRILMKKQQPKAPKHFSRYTNGFNQKEGKDRSRSRKRKKKK